MHKRGQIYLLVALVMSVIIFGMVTVSNKVGQEDVESSFEALSSNYAVESSKLINAMLDEADKDIADAFRNFTLLFTSYSKTQNPQFEMIYAFDFNNKVYVGNYLRSKLIVCTDIECEKPVALKGCYSEIPATVSFDELALPIELYQRSVTETCETEIEYEAGKEVNGLFLTIGEVTYPFDIKKDQPEVMIVSWESKDRQRKVFTEGSFITGGSGAVITLSGYCDKICDQVFCTTACKSRCGFIATKEECDLNSEDCRWALDGCVNVNL